MSTETKPKRVTLNLVGLDGNAFFLIGAFMRQAKREGWTPDEIDAVVKECESGDYDHLLQTLIRHTKSADEDNED